MGDLGLVSRADQFVFGYDDGHRLLVGSRELPRALMVRLLVATDAVMTAGCPPLITGLALPESAEYAFCVTWADPRAARSGAVCSHVLLVDAASLADPRAVPTIVGHARNPAGESLDSFAVPASLRDGGEGARSGFASGHAPSVELLQRCIQIACRTDGASVVVHPDLAEAAGAIVAIWSAMWPALRARFSFRTRELAAAEHSEFALTAAPRLSGGSGLLERVETPTPRWLEKLAAAVASSADGGLRSFIERFGPNEEPEPARLRWLAELWAAVAFEDVAGAVEQIETHWPDPSSGTALKQALFGGRSQECWSLGERERVAALLGSRHPTWNLGALDLTGRVRALARSAHFS
ncbi:MAG TPA: hypothetical protein VHX66_03470 [Solirubrobacteraceae bacterium]|nr:hypothetical protein [Solirubrobacteraceae bacterium]